MHTHTHTHTHARTHCLHGQRTDNTESDDVVAAMSCECFLEPAWHVDEDNRIDGDRGTSGSTELHFVRHFIDLHNTHASQSQHPRWRQEMSTNINAVNDVSAAQEKKDNYHWKWLLITPRSTLLLNDQFPLLWRALVKLKCKQESK